MGGRGRLAGRGNRHPLHIFRRPLHRSVNGRLDRESDPTNPDTDGDGLRDGFEAAIATNPTATDRDGDGLGDFDEVNEDLDGDARLDQAEDTNGNGLFYRF